MPPKTRTVALVALVVLLAAFLRHADDSMAGAAPSSTYLASVTPTTERHYAGRPLGSAAPLPAALKEQQREAQETAVKGGRHQADRPQTMKLSNRLPRPDFAQRCNHNLLADCLVDPVCVVSRPGKVNANFSALSTTVGGFRDEAYTSATCAANLHFLQSSGEGELNQLSCEPHIEPTPRPCGGDPAATSEVDRFKCLTSWMFPKWYDWSPTATVPSTINDTLRASRINGVFTLENACFTPTGGLHGWLPERINYQGGMEWTPKEHEGRPPPLFHDFLKRSVKLQELPPHFHTAKVLLMPVLGDFHNSGHMAHRAVSAEALLREAFGDGATKFDARDSVTMYVVLKRTWNKADASPADLNGYGAYAGAIGSGRWMSLLGRSVSTAARDTWLRLSTEVATFIDVSKNANRTAGLRPLMCFKQVAVFENCVQPCKVDSPWTWSILGRRTNQTRLIGQRFRQKVAACLSVDLSLRKVATPKNPVVLWAHRSRSRVIADLNFVLEPLVDHFKTVLNVSRFVMVETYRTPMNELFRQILSADIMIGVHGSLLTLALLLPTASVLYELKQSPYNVTDSFDLETALFGASTEAAGVRHLAVTLPPYTRSKRASPTLVTLQLSFPMLLLIANQSVETLRSAAWDAPEERARLRDTTLLDRMAHEILADAHKERLQTLFRMYQQPSKTEYQLALNPEPLQCAYNALMSMRKQGLGARLVEVHFTSKGTPRFVLTDGKSPWNGVQRSYLSYKSWWLRINTPFVSNIYMDGLLTEACKYDSSVSDADKRANCLVLIWTNNFVPPFAHKALQRGCHRIEGVHFVVMHSTDGAK